MCGFTGFIEHSNKRSSQERQNVARRMSDSISHRGPDAGDVWQDPDVPVCLAHRRLSIIDLTPEGAQPMMSSTGRYVIAFNGEVYNFPDLRHELEAIGVAFRGRSDTEIMLAAIEAWGLNQALQKFNGMFAFALWDRTERCIHFIRDRMGKKPLYIGWAGSTLVFGSELKALCAYPDFKKELNPQGLNAYMHMSCVPAPLSIYRNVWSVPAGHRLSMTMEETEQSGADLSKAMQAYWSAEDIAAQAKEHPFDHDDAQLIEDFETLLSRCVKDRMISDVPLGAFLSGGIDSSAVVALMQAQSTNAVKTYTIGFEESGFDEAQYAKKVAAYLGTDHHELYLKTSDAMAVIPYLSGMYDEPFADISALPTYLVSKFARTDVTVALSGDGGDEMLGGYNRHILGPKIWNKTRRLPSWMKSGIGAGIRSISTENWNRIGKALPQIGTRMHKLADMLDMQSEEQIYGSFISTWKNRAHVLNQPETLDNEILQPELQGFDFAEKMMLWDSLGYLPNDILVKVDRASMAVSLEARAPLLDRRIFEYAWRLPMAAKIRQGQGKWLLRQILAKYVPSHLFERPKQGFTMPVGHWLRNDLRGWAEILLDEKTLESDGMFNAKEVRRVWDDHLNGRGNHTERLWSVLMFLSWKEKWL